MDSDQLIQMAAVLRELGVIKPDKTDLLPVYTAIVGALGGALASIIPTVLATRHQAKREKASILCCMLAEIKALDTIISERKYIAQARNSAYEMEAAQMGSTPFSIIIPDSHAQVYRANLGNLGKLNLVDASDIVTFYQLIDAVIVDVKPGGSFSDGGATAEGLTALADLLTKAQQIAQDLFDRHLQVQAGVISD